MARGRNRLALLLGVLMLAALACAGPAAAQGGLEISEFETTSSSSEAGAHPDLRTKFKLLNAGDPEIARDVTFELPRGMFGNPSVMTQCTSVDFSLDQCPPAAQAGVIVVRANYEGNPNYLLGTAPIYSVDPGAGEVARFAFNAPTLNIPIAIPVNVLSADGYRLRFTVSGITQLAPLAAADLDFWGFPAAESHQLERFQKGSPGNPPGCPGEETFFCPGHTAFPSAGMPVLPFTGNPSVCGEEMPTTLRVTTYQNPGAAVESKSKYEPISNCARQTFKPVAQAKLTTTEADSPSGIDLIVKAPQPQSKAASPSQVRSVIVNLPEGLTINPDAADGQSACSDADAGLGTEAPAHCPDNAKIGTITISSAALPNDLEGAIYFGEPKPGSQYRLLIIAEGYGIRTKFLGDLLPDPKTGQIKAVFKDLPQLPFDEYGIHLFASDRGVLATPTHCGIHITETDLFPWNNLLPDQKSQFGVPIESGPAGVLCPGEKRPFNPRLEAGTSNSQAGGFSNFFLKLDRDDGDQFLGDLNFTMPPGLTGSLRGLTYCPEPAIVAASEKAGRVEQMSPSCPLSSKLGTTNVAAGPGSHPFHAVGDIYLAGPFRGAPLSLVAITPALAGPYDYGVVVVRVAIAVDPLDAHVIATSDTVPSIIGGVPIRMRSIQVNLDKPNFMINPTNCAPMSVGSQGIGDQGALTSFSSYFQAINCDNLPFEPIFSVRESGGRKSTLRGKNPALRFDLRTRPGDANIRSLAVTLPPAYAIDQRHLANICSERELTATNCAGRAAIGTATTDTPLLDQPLSGPVYAVSGGGGLPRLAFVLNGQVSLRPRAESKSIGGALKTTVPVVPDAPIGHFVFNLSGGKQGYLQNTRNTCAKPVKVKVDYTAQSEKTFSKSVKVRIPCPGAKGRKGKARRG
jgi:hypothetical protein